MEKILVPVLLVAAILLCLVAILWVVLRKPKNVTRGPEADDEAFEEAAKRRRRKIYIETGRF